MSRIAGAVCGLVVSMGVAQATPFSSRVDQKTQTAPHNVSCPEGLPAGTRCLGGTDSAGAHYLIALPRNWNQVLVLHSHGGPLLGPPRAERVAEDLQRWKIVVQAGYAWAGSSFCQGGVAVRSAAEDNERLRQIFRSSVAVPRRTILHGQSWGASVAAMGAELFNTPAPSGPAYDGVLLTSGVLGGGSRSYDFRLDLRVVYQYLCRNHPLPSEPQYPMWMGLPKDAKLTPAQLAERVQSCLGIGLSPDQRTPVQARNLKTIVNVILIPERSIQSHMNWATFHFRDIWQHRTNRGNVFENRRVRYAGSDDDAALNAGVARYTADPQAVALFAADTDPTGRIHVPVLSVHAVDDPTAFVELEHSFLQTMQKAGTADHLVQTYTSDQEHSYLSDPVYPTLLNALLRWVDEGNKPTPGHIAEACASNEALFGKGCRFLPNFHPASLDSRVPPRGEPD